MNKCEVHTARVEMANYNHRIARLTGRNSLPQYDAICSVSLEAAVRLEPHEERRSPHAE